MVIHALAASRRRHDNAKGPAFGRPAYAAIGAPAARERGGHGVLNHQAPRASTATCVGLPLTSEARKFALKRSSLSRKRWSASGFWRPAIRLHRRDSNPLDRRRYAHMNHAVKQRPIFVNQGSTTKTARRTQQRWSTLRKLARRAYVET